MTTKVGLVYHSIYLEHDTGQHPENARRLEAVMSHLNETGLRRKLIAIEPRAASPEELAAVHDARYISSLREQAQQGGGWLDADTFLSPRSYEAALYAAGGLIRATESVLGGDVGSAFALLRPPGHHAVRERAMGFCLFNNVAVAARYALAEGGLERVAIIDFDVHHGNGTQDAFYDSSQVLYVSTHEYPFYPGTGSVGEVGRGDGRGTTLNVPLPAGCGDARYIEVFEKIIVPLVRRFDPRLILVSAGYDGHWADQLAMMRLSTGGFGRMVGIISELADELCGGRLVFTLEGGYNLEALAASVGATFNILMGNPVGDDPLGEPPSSLAVPGLAPLIASIKQVHNLT
ncbi:histone deacetylase [Chloroflexota bacterium]